MNIKWIGAVGVVGVSFILSGNSFADPWHGALGTFSADYGVEDKLTGSPSNYLLVADGCSYKFKKNKRGKVKEMLHCNSGPGNQFAHRGGPPDHAPAHGYRRKHYQPNYYAANALPPIGFGNCSRDVVGTLLGAAGGGLAGSQIGKGSGRLAAVGAGVFIGGVLGNVIGEHFDQMDPACTVDFLETTPPMQTVEWRSPDGDTTYQVVPSEPYKDTSGRYCREYQSEAVVGNQTERVYGTACRQPDGSWQLMN